ncbi:hypothetical protein CMO89_02520 [Candidatus Woesearchaeota archaeon]|nr:hypothetical protein [Candidatus Woesearchaeota archaeon]|tara:strand:- start:18110 stop:18448 length:339 start_codon:yes stop_codon:yes gene_type:complete
MLLGIQIIGILFGLFMLYLSFVNYKRKEFTIKEFSFWLILWLLFITVTLIPGLLDFFVQNLKLYRTMDLFIILGFMFLIGAVFYTYTIVRRNQKKMEDIVRKMAVEKAEKKP